MKKEKSVRMTHLVKEYTRITQTISTLIGLVLPNEHELNVLILDAPEIRSYEYHL